MFNVHSPFCCLQGAGHKKQEVSQETSPLLVTENMSFFCLWELPVHHKGEKSKIWMINFSSTSSTCSWHSLQLRKLSEVTQDHATSAQGLFFAELMQIKLISSSLLFVYFKFLICHEWMHGKHLGNKLDICQPKEEQSPLSVRTSFTGNCRKLIPN